MGRRFFSSHQIRLFFLFSILSLSLTRCFRLCHNQFLLSCGEKRDLNFSKRFFSFLNFEENRDSRFLIRIWLLYTCTDSEEFNKLSSISKYVFFKSRILFIKIIIILTHSFWCLTYYVMRLRDNYLLIMARDAIPIKVTRDFLERAEWCIIVSVGGRRRNFLSTYVPRGWRARRFSRMTHRTDRGLVVFRVALELLSLALLLRGTPETLLAPTRKRKVSALCSLISMITPVSPQFRPIIFRKFLYKIWNNINSNNNK